MIDVLDPIQKRKEHRKRLNNLIDNSISIIQPNCCCGALLKKHESNEYLFCPNCYRSFELEDVCTQK